MIYGKVFNRKKYITSWLRTEALEIFWVHTLALPLLAVLNKLLSFSELLPHL